MLIWYKAERRKTRMALTTLPKIRERLADDAGRFCVENIRMTQKELNQWITNLIQEDKLYKFYKSKEWIKLRDEILSRSHYECAKCKEKGKISRAVTVHHVQYVKKHPELALSRTYTYNGEEYLNLLPLCHDCHDEEHKRMKFKQKKQFNEERW